MGLKIIRSKTNGDEIFIKRDNSLIDPLLMWEGQATHPPFCHKILEIKKRLKNEGMATETANLVQDYIKENKEESLQVLNHIRKKAVLQLLNG